MHIAFFWKRHFVAVPGIPMVDVKAAISKIIDIPHHSGDIFNVINLDDFYFARLAYA